MLSFFNGKWMMTPFIATINNEDSNSSLIPFCLNALEGSYGTAIQTLGLFLFVLIFNFFVKTILLKLRNRFTREKKIWQLSFVTAFYKPLHYFVWMAAILVAWDILASSIFSISSPIDLDFSLNIVAVLMLGWFLLRWNRKLIDCMVQEQTNNPYPRQKIDLFRKVGTIGILAFTGLLLLAVTGRSIEALITFGGIGGLLLAFASQQIIANFFGGLMIYLVRPFTLGEWVSLPERKMEGNIEEIGWYMTCIRSFDKRPIYVPNSIFMQSIVITPSRMSHERLQFKLHINHKNLDVLAEVISSIRSMLIKHPLIDHQQKVEVYFTNFGDASLEVDVSAYMAIGSDFRQLKQDVLFKIAAIIQEQGAQIAFLTQIMELNSPLTIKNVECLTA